MSRISHVTPAILQRPEGDQLISGAGDVVQGFDPKTGHLIWTLRNEGEGVVPSIVLGRDLVFAASGFPHKIIRAIKSGGKGEIPESNIAWEHQKDVPTMSSFLYLAPHLFTINEAGIAQCLMEDTGEVVWRQRLPGHFSASPVCVDGHLFFLSEEGETIIVAARSDYREIARNSLGERCQASMAVSRQSLFIRTERHLFCVAREKP
jgi:outer membrane protein assembly factor BamB